MKRSIAPSPGGIDGLMPPSPGAIGRKTANFIAPSPGSYLYIAICRGLKEAGFQGLELRAAPPMKQRKSTALAMPRRDTGAPGASSKVGAHCVARRCMALHGGSSPQNEIQGSPKGGTPSRVIATEAFDRFSGFRGFVYLSEGQSND